MTTWWLIWDRGEFDHCLDNPGFDVDLAINCLIDKFVQVWMGGIGLTEAVRAGGIRFDGSSAARDVLVQMLDFRPSVCVKAFKLDRVPPPQLIQGSRAEDLLSV